jgi:hypothetical protein
MYNKTEFPKLMNTAGKITITTAIAGVLVFAFALIFDVGTAELNRVSAQTASTTLTVLNTPPSFTVNAYEVTESSTSTPTNSGDTVQWAAIANDSNGAPYFLLVCSTNATPTARAAANPQSLGTNPPVCSSTSTLQWGVSAATPTDTQATVSTTTLEAFAESNDWYAWVCDDDPFNPRCNNIPVQGFSATNTSPFFVNHRPVLTAFNNSGPVDPGGTITFLSSSTDPDVVDQEDTIKLVVCDSPGGYSTTTNTCSTGFIASTTIGVLSNASTSATMAAIMQDDDYPAYGFIVDQHGHEATANPINRDFTVNNVAPVVLGGDIVLNGITDIILTEEGGETTGFTLDFVISDANSCVNVSSTPEITGFVASVFRSSVGTTTCNGLSGTYNPNNCYPSGAGAATWNLNCTLDVGSCTGPLDSDVEYSCTFPLWFVADPTDAANPNIPAILGNDSWSAGVSGVDDNALTGAMATSSILKDVISLTALELLSAEIPYGSLEPGDNTGTLDATTIIRSVGNTGIDQELVGSSMCGTFAILTPCVVSPSATIPEDQQQFATSSLSYNSPNALSLSSTTQTELELNVAKSISTSTPSSGTTYWGIEVPLSITLAGAYSGLNTFTAVTAEAVDWGY